jgi:hypothetical protein
MGKLLLVLSHTAIQTLGSLEGRRGAPAVV